MKLGDKSDLSKSHSKGQSWYTKNYILLTPNYLWKEEIVQSLNFSRKHTEEYIHISFYICILYCEYIQ